jgi:AbrB family looped-hinge helix DNA binding protein
MAVLHARGAMKVGDSMVHESIIGSRFTGRIVGTTMLEVSTGPPTESVDLLRKPHYHDSRLFSPGTPMSTLLVSSKGQIVLPAALRRRLGMGAGARIEVLEESDGLKLRVVRAVATADVTGMAGMVKAKARGVPRRLEDFDPAAMMLTRPRRSKP